MIADTELVTITTDGVDIADGEKNKLALEYPLRDPPAVIIGEDDAATLTDAIALATASDVVDTVDDDKAETVTPNADDDTVDVATTD